MPQTYKKPIDLWMEKEHHLRQELGVKVIGMDKLKPLKAFSDLPFYEKVKRNLDEQGWRRPTPIQSYAIPIILSNRHIIGVSSTGSGKTLAYTLPLTFLAREAKARVLVLAPTRELAKQIAGEFSKLMGRDVGCVYGGVPLWSQNRELAKKVVVATPGRFIHFLEWGRMNTEFDFVVLDEADRLLEGTFLEDLEFIFKKIGDYEQISLFSATITKDVEAIARKFMKNQVRLTIGGTTSYNKNISQQIIQTGRNSETIDRILDILDEHKKDKCLIFTNTKAWAEDLCRTLEKQTRLQITFIHGDIMQSTRERIIGDFRKGKLDVLVATDVASRGLDISDIKLIINFQFPKDLKTYTHRIGRTARYNKKGRAITFIGARQQPYLLYELVDFMVKCGQKIPEYLFRLSGYSQKRVQELEESLAQIEVPQENEPPPAEKSSFYVQKRKSEDSNGSDNDYLEKKKKKSSDSASYSHSNSDEQKDKCNLEENNTSFKKSKQTDMDEILNLSYGNLSWKKKQQLSFLQDSKIHSDKRSFMEDHANFKKQQFDVRKYRPTNVSIAISMNEKKLQVEYEDFKNKESQVLVVGMKTPTYDGIRTKIQECKDKLNASNSLSAFEQAQKIIAQKAIKTVKIGVMENYNACLFVNPPRLKKQYLWKSIFMELSKTESNKAIISMPIQTIPLQGEQIGEALKQISKQLNECKSVREITLLFNNVQMCKQWIEVTIGKKMI